MPRSTTGALQTTGANALPEPSAPSRRRRLDAANAREAILAAAEALLIESGPESLRLTEIASKAGVTHPNILYHFGSIGNVQLQLAQRIATQLAEDIARVFVDGSGTSPVDEAVGAVFRVFDEGGYARLLAWLALSPNEPTFDRLGAELEVVRAAIVAQPALGGDANEERRRRIVPEIELAIVAAIGYGLLGRSLDALFPRDDKRPSVAHVLNELLSRPKP